MCLTWVTSDFHFFFEDTEQCRNLFHKMVSLLVNGQGIFSVSNENCCYKNLRNNIIIINNPQ